MAAASLCLVLAAAGGAVQLPPEIQADLYREQVRARLADGDYGGAKQLLDRILGLQREHGLELPDSFHFEYGDVAQRAGLHGEAVEALTRYLALAGQESEHYRAAVAKLVEAREALEVQSTQPSAGESRVFAGMEFVWVPAGEFFMVLASKEVRISQGFWLGKYEVTQAEWWAVMETNPSEFSGCSSCPVENVSVYDVRRFITNLNAQAGGNRYRLPREAEWEYAARAGTGDRYGSLNAIAWYRDNSGGRPHPVGQKAPSAWGLHDMHGNVSEWMQYQSGGSTRHQSIRGCDWGDGAGDCRASAGWMAQPELSSPYRGFRLLRIE